MLRTILLLICSLVFAALFAFNFNFSPSQMEWSMLKQSGFTMLGFALYCFVVSTITGNHSQVDKLWSILPAVYIWIYYFNTPTVRVLLLSVLISLWAVRLTYNFSRRGAYSWKFWAGEEDYRWEVLRSGPMFQKPWKWVLFNLFFISLYQNALIWFLTLPVIFVSSIENTAITWMEYGIYFLIILFLLIETIADQQQWNFQTEKHRRIRQNEPLNEYAHGFTNTGLWKWVRHPNYAAEQAIWILVYIAGSVAGSHNYFNWSVIGCLLLVLLFQGSADFSEKISTEKYPEYSNYIKNTGKFLPKIK